MLDLVFYHLQWHQSNDVKYVFLLMYESYHDKDVSAVYLSPK